MLKLSEKIHVKHYPDHFDHIYLSVCKFESNKTLPGVESVTVGHEGN